MTPRKRRRLGILVVGMTTLGAATALALFAFQGNLVYFYSPSELAQMHIPAGERVRIGGLVETKSVVHEPDGRRIVFRVTDGKTDVAVAYTGLLPDLFREGQGVVVEGAMRRSGVFAASTVLAKHDAKYMPPEVVQELKKTGHWKEGAAAAIRPLHSLTPPQALAALSVPAAPR